MSEYYGSGNEAFQGDDGQLYANSADAEAERDPVGREYILVIPGERYAEDHGARVAGDSCSGHPVMIGAGWSSRGGGRLDARAATDVAASAV